MKAVVLHAYGSPSQLKFEEREDPKPGKGEVLVAVSAASINPIDWKMRSGAVKDHFPIEFPAILGRDLAGVVREVGEGVEGFASGDTVMALTMHTYAELCCVNSTDLVKIPSGLNMTTAAALPLVNITGDQLIRLGTNAKPGQTVLITGALGAVGRSAIFAASEVGAKVVAGVRGNQLDAVRQLHGVTEAIAIDNDTEIDALGLVDGVTDTIGGNLAGKLLAKVKPGGTFGWVSAPPQNVALHPMVHVNAVLAKPDAAVTRHYAEAVRDGKFTIPIDRIVPLADAAVAHAAAEKGGIGKIVLTA
jgi:NADPH:quinone reductase-like Zn-dependent oxidoreductase